MTPIVLTTLITTIAAAITGAATWIFSRQKRDVELEQKKTAIQVKDAEIVKLRSESSAQIMSQYQNALDDLKSRYDERFEYLKTEYRIRHQNLKADYERKHEKLKNDKHSEIEALKKEIENLRRNLELWKRKYRDLKREIQE